MLTQGRDYLLFEKVDCTQLSMITTMTPGAVIITANLIAVLPLEPIDSGVAAPVATPHDGDALRFVKALLADPAIDVAKLEAALTAMYAGSYSRWVFPLDRLERFKVTGGFFGMISLKMPRESARRLVIRDKGGKSTAAAFLSHRTAMMANELVRATA